ncbi:hypothetical protein PBAL39_12845 [Pedobacter sp. BAL39]|uniref:tubulin-like doman-containing protein n=1 Tax=Pedobacter sp. BAL39 TaxID=391596 RepID=UPI000155923D|nr:tubulin-like doman-containing protein [Pedobacter sp. BAL39]EDM35357.1 hypothetical protein PBAL39_12845 [Pedobacter sp. BAL39]
MIRNTFIFGIGGTGARVVRALTMLLAAGSKLNDTNKVIPIIIDVDTRNADTSRTLKALEAYKLIRSKAYAPQRNSDGSDSSTGFFNTNLNTLSSLQTEGSEKIDDSFQLKFDNLETSFIKYVDPKEELVNDVTMDMLRALYDDTPSNHERYENTELNLRLDEGFKGNPNIGCVVFNGLSSLKEYQFVAKSINPDDRIFIVSSIFGGTGSSGFPQLIKLIKGDDRLRDIKIGALTVMPYYKIEAKKKTGGDGKISSESFDAKTEAALSYYAKHMAGQLNALYHVWDTAIKQYEYNAGGDKQLDPAHLVEMIGATAIIDFVNKPDEALGQKGVTKYFDYGIIQESSSVDFRHFYNWSASKIMQPLALLSYAMKVYLDYIPNLTGEVFYKDLLKDSLHSDLFYQTLSSFFDTHFRGWLKEMASNERKFEPVQLDESLNSFITGKVIPIKKIFGIVRDSGLSASFLSEKLGKIEDELRKTIPDTEKEKRFLQLLNQIALECYNVLGALPTMTE